MSESGYNTPFSTSALARMKAWSTWIWDPTLFRVPAAGPPGAIPLPQAPSLEDPSTAPEDEESSEDEEEEGGILMT